MEETPPSGLDSRRSFLLKSITPLAALWLQGCAGSISSIKGGPATRSNSRIQESDHPLSALSFGAEHIVSSQMDLRKINTPIQTAEGNRSWHQKGAHPYIFRISDAIKSPSWENSRHALHTPPSGIRSSVPLGGLGTGTIELRADGRLADWQIFNNSPGAGEKVHIDDAFFAIRTVKNGEAPQSVTLRTHPPGALPAADAIGYAGAFPASRLRVLDDRLPLSVSLYGYGLMDLQNPTAAQTPAVVFSILLSNPGNEAVETSIMYNQPNHLEGTFRTERGLILSKSGSEPSSGELCMEFSSNLSVTSKVASELDDIWETFDDKGNFENETAFGLFQHGAIATALVLEPGASRTVSLVLSWHFPNRTIAAQQVGNAYTERYKSASEVSSQVIRQMPKIWRDLNAWDAFISGNALPSPIQRGLRNSLSQLFKTSFCTKDGRWRSWDSFADANLSSIEMTLYRALPLLFVDVSMFKSVMRAYAFTQTANGRITDNLGHGERRAMDTPLRSSGNKANPAFFILSFAYFSYAGEIVFVKELWPHMMKALNWQLSITTPEGLPSNLPALNDWASLSEEGMLLEEAILHLAGLKALVHMADAIDRNDDVSSIEPLLAAGLKTLQYAFTGPSGFKFSTGTTTTNAALESRDLLLGFIWADLLGFDDLLQAIALGDVLDQIHASNAPAISLSRTKTGNSLSPAMAMNWAANHIQQGKSTSRSFDLLNKLFEHQEKTLADGWGQYDRLSMADGMPLANPHHVSHLAIWFLLVALSGQRYDAANKKLSLSPKMGNGARIPFFLPEAKGMITVQRSGRFLIEIISGRLELKTLAVGENILYRDMLIEEGQVVQLKP